MSLFVPPADYTTTVTSMTKGPSHSGRAETPEYTDEQLHALCLNKYIMRCQVLGGGLDDSGTIGGVTFSNQLIRPRPDDSGLSDCVGISSIDEPTNVNVKKNGNKFYVSWTVQNSPFCGAGTSGNVGMQGVAFRFYWEQGTPDTKDITDEIITDGEIRPEVTDKLKKAVDLINSIHKTNGLPDILFSDLPDYFGNSNGSYVSDSDKPFPEIIVKRSKTIIDTIIHEIGHWIDQNGLSCFSNKSTTEGWGSNDPSLVKDFLRAAQRSELYSRILNDPEIEQYNKDYFLSNHELWARAYTQYIAEKSGDPELLEAIEKKVNVTDPDVITATHWTDADFEPIKREVEKILNNKGWLK